MRFRVVSLLILAALMAVLATPATAQEEPSDDPVVQGVFFFSPTCPHCEQVIAADLPGMFLATGGEPSLTFDESLAPQDVAFYLMSNGTLQLLMVDTSVEAGSTMFVADSQRLGMDRAGVPRLDVADEYLVGSLDIPERFPGIVERGLAEGGIAWPPVPGIEAAVEPLDAAVAITPSDDDAAALPATLDESPLDKLARDPVGNAISIIVLLALLGSLIAVPVLAARGSLGAGLSWPVPVLLLVGIGVAAYLASIETSGGQAVCGPVGDCNAVQESEYAALLGVPIGVLGTIGYGVMLALWAVGRFMQGRVADWALIGLAACAAGGTLFSAYLTFLEPFVIGATCMWCISSALVMLALLWLTAGPAWAALHRPPGSGSPSGQRGGRSRPASSSVGRPA